MSPHSYVCLECHFGKKGWLPPSYATAKTVLYSVLFSVIFWLSLKIFIYLNFYLLSYPVETLSTPFGVNRGNRTLIPRFTVECTDHCTIFTKKYSFETIRKLFGKYLVPHGGIEPPILSA